MRKKGWLLVGVAIATLTGFRLTSGDKIKCPTERWTYDGGPRWALPSAHCFNDWYYRDPHCHGHDQSIYSPGGTWKDCHAADGNRDTKCWQCCKDCLDDGNGKCLDSHPHTAWEYLIINHPGRVNYCYNGIDWYYCDHKDDFWFRRCGDQGPKAECHYRPCDNGKQISHEDECK